MKKVICIDVENVKGLTLNNTYEVLEYNDYWFWIIDDNGKRNGYNKLLFKETSENKELNIIEASNMPYGTEFKTIIDHYYKYDDACRIRDNTKMIAVNTQSGIRFKEYSDIERASKSLINAKFIPIQNAVSFEEARKEYRENKKTIQSCVSERIFRNGIDTEIGFSEIEGQWIVLD